MKITKSLTRHVRHELKKYLRIPQKGLIAGSSVSNIILNYFNGSNLPYNDIDLFVQNYSYESVIKKILKRQKNNYTLNVSDDTEYKNPHSFSYNIENVIKVNMINIIRIDLYEKNINEIIESFDFNAVQCGYDCSTKKIVFTKEFESFVDNGEDLKITCLNRPFSTVFRLLKKIDECGFYANIEKEFSKIAQILYYVEDESAITSTMLPETLDKYKSYIAEVRKFFLIERDIHNDKVVFRILPLIPRDDRLKEASYFVVSRFIKILYDIPMNQHKRKISELIINTKSLCFILAKNPYNFIDSSIPASLIDSADKFVHKHLGLFDNNKYKATLTFYDVLKIIKNAKKIIKNYGMFAIGIIESISGIAVYILDDIMIEGILPNSIIETIKKQLKARSIQLIEPYNLDYSDIFEKDISVKELTTSGDLFDEGEKMHNCVGGYSWNLKNKYSRIFSIVTNGDNFRESNSTLEISFPESIYDKYRIVQHLSVANNPISSKHAKIASDLVKKINDTLEYKREKQQELALSA